MGQYCTWKRTRLTRCIRIVWFSLGSHQSSARTAICSQKPSRVGEYTFAGYWAGVRSDDFGISIEWHCRYYVANWEGKFSRVCRGKGRSGGRAYLDSLNVRASRHELVRWVQRSGQVVRVSGEKPRLGQIDTASVQYCTLRNKGATFSFFNDQPSERLA
jgi:hypothetical protein